MSARSDTERRAFADTFRADYRARIPQAGSPDSVGAVRALSIPLTGPDRTLAARVYAPHATPAGLPVVLFLHGGGWSAGDLDTHDVLARALTNASGALVVALDYRLAPEHPFPAGLDDAYATVQWLARNAGTLGGDGTRIAIAGDSAGGNLAAATCLVTRERGGAPIAAQVLLYANTDARCATDAWRALGDKHFPTHAVMDQVLDAYLQGHDPDDPHVSPLRAELHDLPRALVITGSSDPLSDEGRAYADRLRDAGVAVQDSAYPGAEHGFVQFFKADENQPMGAAAIAEAGAFLRAAHDVS